MARTHLPIKKDLLDNRFDYHFNLTDRRWQYFAAFLVVTGLLLTSWKDIIADDPIFAMFVASGAIFSSVAFLRFVSRMRATINTNALELNKLAGERVIDVPAQPSINIIGGVNMWLYITVIAMTMCWFYKLYSLNIPCFWGMVMLFIANLCTLHWKTVALSEDSEHQHEPLEMVSSIDDSVHRCPWCRMPIGPNIDVSHLTLAGLDSLRSLLAKTGASHVEISGKTASKPLHLADKDQGPPGGS